MNNGRSQLVKAEHPQHVRWAVHASRTGQASQRPSIPQPKPQQSSKPYLQKLHGDPIQMDPFRWLQAGHRNPDVLRYLQQESEYSKLQLRHLSPLRGELSQEIAELVWRQALMMAAQQPYLATRDTAQLYGGFEYRREAVHGSTTQFRHLRISRPYSSSVKHDLGLQNQEQQQQQQGLHGEQPSDSFPRQQQQQREQQLISHSPDLEKSCCVLDEAQRAAACASPAVYALHSFVPSPEFCLAAFSETMQPEPPGQRLPDRFTLHIVHVETGTPAREPLQNVSGDIGWISLNDASGSSPRAAGGRVYFTRAAQRELWCIDFSLLPTQPPGDVAGGLGVGSGPVSPLTDTHLSPHCVFIDTDGQPIQLVQYGSCLYCETLGNTGVPLEIRLLGVASVGADGANGSRSQLVQGLPAHGVQNPTVSDGMQVAAAVGRGPASLIGTAAAASGPVAPDGGVTLLPRRPGRQYSALRIELRAADTPAAELGSDSSGGDGNSKNVQDGTRDRCLLGRFSESLVLWLRDLDHPNGCLLLAVIIEPCRGDVIHVWGHSQPLLLELLPHNPALRIVHVEAGVGGQLLCVRKAVDPEGRYEVEELRLDLDVVQRAIAGEPEWINSTGSSSGGGGGESPASQPAMAPASSTSPAPSAEAGENLHRSGKAGCRESYVDICSYVRTASALAVVLRHRTVTVGGPRQHVLRVVGWDGNGLVTLTCSSMASPPVSSTVELQLYVRQSSGSADASIPVAPESDRAGRDAAVELRCAADVQVVTERLWATSHDGVQVPITLCRMDSQPCVPGPLLLRVYGAYGKDPPTDYQPALQPLLRRGVAVAVAHVRGGGQLGPAWYEAGRGAVNKANSHLDLLAVARHLVDIGVTTPAVMCLAAESAGGWAAGPALNMVGADLFRAAILTVPTLDVLTSLLEDPSYGPYELGDPRVDIAQYRAIMQWSPYDGLGRVPGVKYPALLLRIGLFDTNVPYWDPAKYMARLRSLSGKSGGVGNMLRVMQVKPAGHKAYDNVNDDATFCAFVLWAAGLWPGSSPRTRKWHAGMRAAGDDVPKDKSN